LSIVVRILAAPIGGILSHPPLSGGPIGMKPVQNTSDLADAIDQAPRKRAIPFRERLACSIDEACAAGGFGRTKAYELINSGRLKVKKKLTSGRWSGSAA